MAKFKVNTNSLTIAHYILLFLVTGLCIAIIAWVLISRNNSHPQNDVTLTHIKNSDPCVQRTIETVKKLWEFNPRAVPQKYWDIAMNYMNQTITENTYGICQDVAFTCHRGQIRRDCDPCAVPSARTYAMAVHTADMIQSNCKPND